MPLDRIRGSAALLLTCVCAAAFAAPVSAQKKKQDPEDEGPQLEDLQTYVAWMRDYRSGAIRLMHDLEVDTEAVEQAELVMNNLASWNNMAAANKLLLAATVDPQPAGARSSTDQIDFHAELQPWKIRDIARRAIASMDTPALEPWLFKMLKSRNLRGKKDHADRAKAEAAIEILGHRESPAARLELIKASRSLPPEYRLRALDVLSETAGIEQAKYFVEMLRDRDPDVRIAALNALGNALRPHTDETVHDKIPEAVATLRDEVLEKIKPVLLRDRVWQVRAAAGHNLSQMRTRHAIPILIDGLDAELKREKDPWAMDVKLHRLLEGMTGLALPLGSIAPWQAFWSAEKDRFRVAKPDEVAAKNARSNDGRYTRFFSLELESDAMLFVVDFSGSMKETIRLQTETTAAKSGESIEKAKLVVDEMKKIILSLPDKSVFNIIVFSDNVRVWRPNRDGNPTRVELNDESRDDLLGSFLDSLQPQGPTNLHGALDRAMNFAGRGLKDKYYALDFDTIYILSDGAPSYGRVTDKTEIRRLVREANRLKRMTIHAITFGELNDVEFLRDLAQENGGRHIHVQ